MRLTTNPGESLTRDRRLADRLAEVARRGHRGVGRRRAAHDLDQRHGRHRVEEVDAYEALGTLDEAGERGHRQARGVGGDDRVGPQGGGGALEQAALDVERLGRRLDEQVGVGAGRHVEPGGDAPQGGVAVGRRDAALLDGPAELLFDAGHALGDELVGDVDHGRPQAGLDGHLHDARTHLPGPRDQHVLDFHPVFLLLTAGAARHDLRKTRVALPASRRRRGGGDRSLSAGFGEDPYATIGSLMDCKFLDSYQAADLDGSSIDVWYCRKRDPFVLGPSREVALATCSGCRLSDHTRPPSELAYEVERRNQELVALNAIVSAVNSSLDLATVLNTGLDKAIEILQVDAGWISLVTDDALQLALHRGVSDEYARALAESSAQEGVVGLVAREQETAVVDDISPSSPTAAAGRGRRACAPSWRPPSRRRADCSASWPWPRAPRAPIRPTTSTS